MIKLFILWCIRTFTLTNIMWFFRAVWCWVFVWHRYEETPDTNYCHRGACVDKKCSRCNFETTEFCVFHKYNSY